MALQASMVAYKVKNQPAMQKTQFSSPYRGDPLEKGLATHSSILAWRITWTEEPSGLQFMGSQGPTHQSKTQFSPQPVPPIRKLALAFFPHPSVGREKQQELQSHGLQIEKHYDIKLTKMIT